MVDVQIDESKTISDSGYAVTPSELLPILNFVLSPFHLVTGDSKPMAPTFIWGKAGIGKTDIVKQFSKKHHMRCVAIHLPQYDPVDLKGIPVKKDNDNVVWVPSSYLPKEKTFKVSGNQKTVIDFDFPYAKDIAVIVKKWSSFGEEETLVRFNDTMVSTERLQYIINSVNASIDIIDPSSQIEITIPKDGTFSVSVIDKAVLFLDELSAAVPEVQKAALQLVLDRRVGEWDVPSVTPIIAAGNDLEDFAHTHQLSAPLDNRFFHVKLIPSVEDFKNYAIRERLHPDIIGFVHFHGIKVLDSFNGDSFMSGNHGFSSPRSLANLSPQLDSGLGDKYEKLIAMGFLGKEVGNSFDIHRKYGKDLPSADKVLDGYIEEEKNKLLKLKTSLPSMFAFSTRLSYAFVDRFKEHHNVNFKLIDTKKKEWENICDNFLHVFENYTSPETIVNMFWFLRELSKEFNGHQLVNKIVGPKSDEFFGKHVEAMKRSIRMT